MCGVLLSAFSWTQSLDLKTILAVLVLRYSRLALPPRRHASPRAAAPVAQTSERALAAAADLVAEEAFHPATMDDLARRAGVAGATVFARCGSKLGVLEALSLRCARGPEMRAIREAQ